MAVGRAERVAGYAVAGPVIESAPPVGHGTLNAVPPEVEATLYVPAAKVTVFDPLATAALLIVVWMVLWLAPAEMG